MREAARGSERESSSERGIGIVGARALPYIYQEQVCGVVQYLLKRGYHIHSGGASGADRYALHAVITQGACRRAVIFSAWSGTAGFPRDVRPLIDSYLQHDGNISWGLVSPRSPRGLIVAGLLARNARLVRASAGLAAFLYGESRGTTGTVLQAVKRGLRVVVFLCGKSVLPAVSGGEWRQLRCGGVWSGGYRFMPD